MGKLEEHRLHVQRRQEEEASAIFCRRCSMHLSTIGRQVNLKCVLVLILSVAVLLSAVFWFLPRHFKQSEFDAKEAIKLSATIQAYFMLQMPVSDAVHRIARLEYDIYGEIGVPFTKFAVLSMHEARLSNQTNVVFGVLSDPIGSPINPVSLSVLRSSLIELFLQESNLTLTPTSFEQPSSFEILKFPGGITVIPEQSTSIWQIPQILFNFTLNNSIYEINKNVLELKGQLKIGLHLRPYENVYIQVTSKTGSTKDSPVTVEASITSDFGNLLPQRLRQLAEIITGSPPSKNLGLDNSVFGKVKEISLSSYLNHSLHAASPAPSPGPSPMQNEYAAPSVSPSPMHSPVHRLAPSPNLDGLPPCPNCDASPPSSANPPYVLSPENEPHHSSSPMSSSPAPLARHTVPPCGSRIAPTPSPLSHTSQSVPSSSPHASAYPPHTSSITRMPPGLSPLPAVSYGSRQGQDTGNERAKAPLPNVSPSISSSPSSTAAAVCKNISWLCLSGLLIVHILFGHHDTICSS